jgi:hypothetical protein
MHRRALRIGLLGFVFVLPLALLAMGAGNSGSHGGRDSHSGSSGTSGGSSSAASNTVRRGLEISPVSLDFRHKDRDLVGHGSYLVNALGGCNDCHTCPSYAPGVEHNPFLGGDGEVNADGYLAGGLRFDLGPAGTVVSRNLTPDASGKPAGLSLAQFRQAIRTGHDPESGDILQVMPWPVYRNMTDQDLRSIYEFLKAIPSQDTPAEGACQMPGQATFPG